jgi:hypothetical protein
LKTENSDLAKDLIVRAKEVEGEQPMPEEFEDDTTRLNHIE